ncbi:hypothetical protein SCHPADRAFT_238042 [Schizopora paradoxa]|uniref:Zn(2)-C6 fungal-type domain-containing protein n=1 Tax=Schizopora paradoxa TaxID=27342 RepID=A0A0H2RVE4_9AGAM|nr:hypothetical protein SCHPADRAFT_238042 [Schizopora paradoxa]
MADLTRNAHSFHPSLAFTNGSRPRKPTRRINKNPCQWCQRHRYKCIIESPFSQSRCKRCTLRGAHCTWEEKMTDPKFRGRSIKNRVYASPSMPAISNVLDHTVNIPTQTPDGARMPGQVYAPNYRIAPRFASLESTNAAGNHPFHLCATRMRMGEPPPDADYDHLPQVFNQLQVTSTRMRQTAETFPTQNPQYMPLNCMPTPIQTNASIPAPYNTFGAAYPGEVSPTSTISPHDNQFSSSYPFN